MFSNYRSSKPKEWSSTLLDHPAQLFFSLKSLKGLKTNEDSTKIYCLASLEKQTIQTTTLTINKNCSTDGGNSIEWNEGYTFDVISPTSELSLSIWQTTVNNQDSLNNNHNSGGRSLNQLLIDDPMAIDRNNTPTRGHMFNNQNNGKLIGRLSIPFSMFQTQFIDQWFSLSSGQSNCSIHLKLSFTNSSNKVTLDDFIVLRMIGKGGFGFVNLVKKVDTGRLYAMKVVKKEKCLDLNAVQHTFTERKLLKKYYHPFIVGLKYSFQTQDSLCMVLDYIGGGELFYHINERETFSEDTARFYIAQIMLAIGFLHEHGVIYRDLKLENLLMDLDGNLCLVDFGLCKEGAKEGMPTYTMCGSPEYMAPETISGSGYGKSVDWWALGTLFYEMIVGLPPFYSEDPHEMTKLILSAPLKFPPGISKNATSLVSMLLNRDPSKRLGSGESDVEEIKSHPFFRSINWTKVLNKEIDPPFKPHLNGPLDLSYFDPLCTIHSLPVNPNTYNNNLSETDQMAFQGFSYSAPEFFNLTSNRNFNEGDQQQYGGGSSVNSSPMLMTPNGSLNNKYTTAPTLSQIQVQMRSNNTSPIHMQYSNSPSSAQSTPTILTTAPTSPESTIASVIPPNPTIKQNGSWVQPQYPHLHQPLPLKPLFTKLQERRRSLSVNAQTQFTLALGPDDGDDS